MIQKSEKLLVNLKLAVYHINIDNNERGFTVTKKALEAEIKSKATEFLFLNQKIKELESAILAPKQFLRDNAQGSTIYLPEHLSKVVVGTSTTTKSVDGNSLAKHLIAAGRIEELLAVVTINKSSLDLLLDGSELAKKFEVEGTLREATVKSDDLSVNDKKKILAEASK